MPAAVLIGEADLVDHQDVAAMDIYVVGGDARKSQNDRLPDLLAF